MDRCKDEPSVTNRKEVIAISVKWQPSWISQNAQECGVHTHRILNKDPIDGQNPLKTTMNHISPRQNLLPIDYAWWRPYWKMATNFVTGQICDGLIAKYHQKGIF